MALDTATVKRIALLARLEVEDGQLPHLAGELSSILGLVEQLGAVDTEGVEPMLSVAAMLLALRRDAVEDGAAAEAVLANAPQRIDEYFTVPKVVE